MKVGIFAVEDDPLLGPFLETLKKNKIEISALIFDTKGFTDLGHEVFGYRTKNSFPILTSSELKTLKINKYMVSNHNSTEARDIILDQKLDLILCLGTPRILKNLVLKAPTFGILGCHPGIIPNYRGCSCVEWALVNKDPVGNSIFFLNEQIDAGPVLQSAPVNYTKDDDYFDIRIKTYKQGLDLFANSCIKLISDPKIVSSLQKPTGGTYYNSMPKEEIEKLIVSLTAPKQNR